MRSGEFADFGEVGECHRGGGLVEADDEKFFLAEVDVAVAEFGGGDVVAPSAVVVYEILDKDSAVGIEGDEVVAEIFVAVGDTVALAPAITVDIVVGVPMALEVMPHPVIVGATHRLVGFLGSAEATCEQQGEGKDQGKK